MNPHCTSCLTVARRHINAIRGLASFKRDAQERAALIRGTPLSRMRPALDDHLLGGRIFHSVEERALAAAKADSQAFAYEAALEIVKNALSEPDA